jgi:class I fructose-bisphosphate aldolase/fructose-bisphosphate aldolase/2-amino-3,7-dideoxy-D-threo-hept-6-ulosonate synthase
MLSDMIDGPLRLRRITDPASGRALLLSFTAGIQIGRVAGMEDLAAMIGSLASTSQVTGAVVHAGVLDSLLARFPGLGCGVIVDLFGGTWLRAEMGAEQICSLEHAMRVGADAVLTTVSLGAKDESRTLRLSGQVARECSAWGMPLVVMVDTFQTEASRQYSATLSGHGARLAYELGADMVIVNYPGQPEPFADAVRGVDIPVLIGGAPRMETDAALLQSVEQAVKAGAAGVCLPGTLFWKDDAPMATLSPLMQVIAGTNAATSSR